MARIAHGTRTLARALAPALVAPAFLACGGGAAPLDEGALFRDVTAELGLPAEEGAVPDGTFFLPEAMGGGVGLLDVQGDGRLDIFQVRTPLGERQTLRNSLYLQGDDGRFENTSEAFLSGVMDAIGQGLAVGDIENDGDPDVYVTNYGADHLLRNEAGRSFVERAAAAGLQHDAWSSAAAFFDPDADGDLDLYVVHYLHYDPAKDCFDPSSRREYCGPRSFAGQADTLFRNRGDGTFEDATAELGLSLPDGGARAHGLGIAAVDLTGDGRTDVFVANDAQSNQLWANRGDGSFAEEGILRGVAVSGTGQPEASMGVTVGDLDGDGRLDLFMTHLYKEENRLYLGTPGPLLRDASRQMGLGRHDLEFTGFGCGLFDADNDGDLDLAVVNGAIRQRPRLAGGPAGFWGTYAEPNQLYLNRGAGRMELAQLEGGDFTRPVEVGRGLAYGDLDGDGDLDLVQTNVGNRLRVLRNQSDGARGLLVRVLDEGRDALGATVVLQLGPRELRAMVHAAASYLSSIDPRVHFGLGAATRYERLSVRWGDGSWEDFPGGNAVTEVVVRRGEGAVR